MKIGYLGPPGSFSEEAALEVGKIQDLINFTSFRLVKALEEEKVQKAVLPIENSIEGSVNWVFDFLFRNNFPFVIENEVICPIKQNLIGFGQIPNLEVVYSHPQALAQCRKFLSELGVKTKDTDSTSEAVQLVAEGKNPTIAALGTKRAAEIYYATVIKENVNDNDNNQTRFIILGKEKKERTEKDKTSFIFGTKDKPGALYRVLEVFDVLRINMTMIISRPSKRRLGEYVFFIDIEGHQQEDDLKIAFRKIKERVSFLKVLGSYPRAAKQSPVEEFRLTS